MSKFIDKLVPVKSHVIALDPSAVHALQRLTETYEIYWNNDCDYLIQRLNGGSLLICGGGERGNNQIIDQALNNCDN